MKNRQRWKMYRQKVEVGKVTCLWVETGNLKEMENIKGKYKAKGKVNKNNCLSFQGLLTEKRVAEKFTPRDTELRTEKCGEKNGHYC